MTTVSREKRKAEFETYLRRTVKRFNKELLVDTHKVVFMSVFVFFQLNIHILNV